jgi:hypothetical protein
VVDYQLARRRVDALDSTIGSNGFASGRMGGAVIVRFFCRRGDAANARQSGKEQGNQPLFFHGSSRVELG